MWQAESDSLNSRKETITVTRDGSGNKLSDDQIRDLVQEYKTESIREMAYAFHAETYRGRLLSSSDDDDYQELAKQNDWWTLLLGIVFVILVVLLIFGFFGRLPL